MKDYSDWEIKAMISSRPTEIIAYIKQLKEERDKIINELAFYKATEVYQRKMQGHSIIFEDNE